MPAWPVEGARLVTVGRFLSPTRADDVLLSFATHGPWNLTILVLTAPHDPITFEARRDWLQARAPRAAVRSVAIAAPAGIPRAAADATWGADGANWSPGADEAVLHAAVGADAVIGLWPGESSLARRIGCPFIPVEVPWGTSTSALVRGAWATHHAVPGPIPDVARVVVMGPESTGKTTLVRDLARHYRTLGLGEYLRAWLDAKGAACEPADLPCVVAGHQASEAAVAPYARRVLFCDTDPLMTAVYSRFYYGTLPQWLDRAASARRGGLYVLLDCDVPWVPDPQRDMPHRRDEILDLCREELETRHLSWVLVRGSWEERFSAACTVVGRLVGGARG